MALKQQDRLFSDHFFYKLTQSCCRTASVLKIQPADHQFNWQSTKQLILAPVLKLLCQQLKLVRTPFNMLSCDGTYASGRTRRRLTRPVPRYYGSCAHQRTRRRFTKSTLRFDRSWTSQRTRMNFSRTACGVAGVTGRIWRGYFLL